MSSPLVYAVLVLLLSGAGCAVLAGPSDRGDRPRLPEFDAAWDYDDPAATEVKFREILDSTEGEAEASYRAQLLSQIARAQGLQGEFEAAHATLDKAEKLVRDDMPIAQARCLLERGRVLNSSGRADAARPVFLEAWVLSKQTGLDAHAVDAAHMLAIVGDDDESLAWNMKALELAAASTNPRARRWRGSLHNNIGWTYHARGEYDTALEHFQEALAARREEGDAKRTRIARWCVARCLRSLGRVKEALALQRELETEAAATGASDGYICEEIAECLWLLDEKEEARPYFMRAYETLSRDRWLTEREPQRLARLEALATGREPDGED
jgi:tetratricopeptide (TPR) repeat protein